MTLIRHAEPDDLDELLRLHELARDSMDELAPQFAARPHHADRWRRGVERMLRARPRSIFVAEDGRGAGLKGYVMATAAANEPFSIRRYGYLVCLYVGERSRDRGTGAALLEAAEARFREEGLQAAQVEVSGCDLAAQSFWRSRGFQRFLDRLWRPAESTICAEEDPDGLVRLAHSGDREAVVQLWKEMMDAHTAMDERLSVASDWRDQVEHAVRRWLSDLDSRLVVAETANGVIGFALGALARATIGLGPAEYGHVAHLCVTSAFRRQGVGRRLFASLRDWFVGRGVASIHLYVSCLNPVSQQFWRELGFEDYLSRLWCDLV